MKSYFVLYVFLSITAGCSMPGNDESRDSGTANMQIDTLLAQKLGADEYGMKTYYFAFLKAGPNRSQSQEEAERIQRAHLDNINRLSEEGILVLAGPFLDNGDIRGIYVFDVDDFEEAEKLAETDPAVKSGRLTMELHPWYGSAALLKLKDIHKKIAREHP